ncbi:MAG: ATPase, T2SS/T4P/T4SS family [Kiritimatiellia bacterium]
MNAERTREKGAEARLFSEQLMAELGRALADRGFVTREQIEQLNARRALTGETLHRMLVKEGLVRDSDALKVLSDLTNIPFRRIGDFHITKETANTIQPRVALRYKIMPLETGGGTITLAASEVPDVSTVDSLRMLLGLAIEWVLCSGRDITKSIKHFYGLGAETVDNLVEDAPDTEIELPGRDVSVEAADEGVVRFVNQIIAEAISLDATDIHIEPFESALRLRYRIDGILQEIPVPQGVARLHKPIVSCVKIMADMNIAERRKPHDGRIKVRSGKEEFDLRVSILPTAYGETVNMRILNRSSMFIELEDLGLMESQLPVVKELSALPHGVILLTGPTGSGKTTTLYAVLSRINNNEVKIITVEDPIEYQMQGINQIQTHAGIGLTFASILRSILRHDPDIVLIGEIRDRETADIAVRASLTGHLVFSTLHTNDAPSAITRLLDMDIEPFLISSTLEAVIAQRLVRRICNSCKAESAPDKSLVEEIASVYPDSMGNAKFYHGRGCPNCNFTGYKGRLALFEIMVLNDDLRGMIVHQQPANEIRHKAVEHGLVTLRNDGWRRVLQGMTTVEEVVRVARKTESRTKQKP